MWNVLLSHLWSLRTPNYEVCERRWVLTSLLIIFDFNIPCQITGSTLESIQNTTIYPFYYFCPGSSPIISCLGFYHKHISTPLLHLCFCITHFPRGWPESKKTPMQEGYSQNWGGGGGRGKSYFLLWKARNSPNIQIYEAWYREAWVFTSDPASGKYQDTKKGRKRSFKGYNQFISSVILQNNLLRC